MPAPREAAPASLAALQKKFADHIRDPDNQAAPEGIEARRLAIYQRLFFNNLSNLFGANFPIARKIVPDEPWKTMIRAFMVEHRPTTPLFPEIGREFVRFLAEHPEHYQDRWPWLAELCHWQFQATGARNDEAELDRIHAESDGDLLIQHPVVNPTLRMAAYRWPVHAIRKNRLPREPHPVMLAIWRKRDDALGRLQINPVTARTLEILQENPQASGQVCLDQLADEIEHPDRAALMESGRDLLDSLHDKDVLLGSIPAN